MTKKTLPTLGAGTHVAFDTSGVDRLRDLGATNLVRACASPAIGPNHRDVVEAARLRQIWRRTAETWDDLYSAEVRWETPVILWVTPSLRQRLELWRTCSGLHHKGISRQGVLIVDLPPDPRGYYEPPIKEPFQCQDFGLQYPDEVLKAHLAAARPWPREQYDRAVALWDQFVDPDPRPFARRCQRGLGGFPELGGVWAFFSRFFPRLSADGSLRLSRFDELLLQALSARWKTPVKVYVSDILNANYDFIFCVGELTIPRRLANWAEHDARPAAVERAPGPRGPEYLMHSFIYRLTKHGKRLRERLTDLAEAPRLPVAGTEAYAPEAPWVVREDGRLVRL